MPLNFVASDGTGQTDANSYVSVAFADQYFLDRSITTWTGVTAVKQSALIRGTDYIDKRFGKRFRGTRLTQAQSLEWPRFAALDDDNWWFTGSDVIPRQLQKATCEYALRVITLGELAPDPDNTVGGALTSTREKVGPIEEEKKYGLLGTGGGRDPISGLVSTANIPEYPAADLLLQELLRSSTNKRIVRG